MITTGCNKKEKSSLLEVKLLPGYPSASGSAFLNNKLYITGDDANNLLILDSNLNIIDSVSLYSYAEKRIPKTVKADLEGMTVLPGNKLLIAGSGSLSPNRDVLWIIDPVTLRKDSIRADSFYQRVRKSGIAELNIEGLTATNSSIIFANRGNNGYPKNHLIFTSIDLAEQLSAAPIQIAEIVNSSDSSSFRGVSGLDWSPSSDALILTVSTEETQNSFDDGAIGKSYLWIINSVSSKNKTASIKPDRVADLEEIDARFKGHKIESVCITGETNKSWNLVLAADNDNGSSTLFRLNLSKEE